MLLTSTIKYPESCFSPNALALEVDCLWLSPMSTSACISDFPGFPLEIWRHIVEVGLSDDDGRAVLALYSTCRALRLVSHEYRFRSVAIYGWENLLRFEVAYCGLRDEEEVRKDKEVQSAAGYVEEVGGWERELERKGVGAGAGVVGRGGEDHSRTLHMVHLFVELDVMCAAILPSRPKGSPKEDLLNHAYQTGLESRANEDGYDSEDDRITTDFESGPPSLGRRPQAYYASITSDLSHLLRSTSPVNQLEYRVFTALRRILQHSSTSLQTFALCARPASAMRLEAVLPPLPTLKTLILWTDTAQRGEKVWLIPDRVEDAEHGEALFPKLEVVRLGVGQKADRCSRLDWLYDLLHLVWMIGSYTNQVKELEVPLECVW